MHHLPVVQGTGIPTQSFQTGGLMAASQVRAPLTEGAAVTMDIRGLSLQPFRIFLNKFLLQFLVFIVCSILAEV